ncbi:DUF4846 domain-containing protein [Fulvivirga ulvae]|uniref:DUF4846 domain-containing protein n=1 Tax=Fulvivirga ulvae TaxID=2904245 RepID=UPI001F3A29C9|nr:DUF4846 domain-containing protein [Fulvivirga ulvae]UII34192.1 DUF4846 domain-containing protein [Fulvivirga ulvae]
MFQACGQTGGNSQATAGSIGDDHTEKPIINTEGNTLEARINTPDGFERVPVAEKSFGQYLRQLPLKPDGTMVRFYNGLPKPNFNVYTAVVDLEIGERDLHQCADAVIRLRAEHLWNQKEYDKIHFNFTNGFRVDYSEWMKGKRIAVKGNDVSWYQAGSPSNTYKDFWKYMEIIFSYAGTLSLAKELKPVKTDHLQIGDVFVQGGSPGHAVIVVDVATRPETGGKIFLLAQSYMPAQQIQILKNRNEDISPWYSADFGEVLETPEWTFTNKDLKRFGE